MGKILGILIVILLVAGGAYYLGMQRAGENMTNGNATTTEQNQGATTGESKEVDPMIVGTWESTEDPKFTREFFASGTLTDRYDGDESATENAAFVTIDPSVVSVPSVPTASLAGVTVIRVDFASGPMFFSINELSETELAMTNLSGRGNILRFTKVK